MSLTLDPIAARQRHQEMLREAEQSRLARQARQAAKAHGAESLLSRMVRLLSRSSNSVQTTSRSGGTLNRRQLADANSR